MTHDSDSQPLFPAPSKGHSILFLIAVGLFGLGLGFLINVLDPFLYTEKVRLLAPPWLKNTALSLITIMALLVALVVQPVVGRWSDRTRSRWGRRAPFLTVGVVGVSAGLALVVVAHNLWLLIGAAMLVSAFSNTVQGPWQALIPDRIPEAQHGTAAGIKTLLELVGVVAGVTVVGLTLARGYVWAAPLTAIGLFLGILLVTLYGLRQDRPVGEATPQPASETANRPINQPENQRNDETTRQNPAHLLLAHLQSAHSSIRAVPGFAWWILNRFLFWSAAIAVRTFMLNYMEDVLLFPPAEAQLLSSRMFLLLGAGVLVLALPAGVVADRIGRHPLLLAAGLLAAGGSVLLIFVRELPLLFVAGGLIAVGAGIFASSSWALATDLVPKTQGALYLGLANGATVMGSIGGRLGGPLIDSINQLTATVTLGYLVVFGIAALFFAGSSGVILRVPRR
ncbi:MAG: MFS transporter [Anaerolineae bacterium]|nr:MFS transporter [Anaerolineae bacterium]